MHQNENASVSTFDNGDEPCCNHSDNPTFASILETRLARRTILKGSLGAAMVGLFGIGLSACGSDDNKKKDRNVPGGGEQPLLGFQPIPTSEADTIVVPPGYRYHVLAPWGTPIAGTYPAFSINNTGAEQAMQVGMHHDGMHFFPIEGSSADGLLVMNHEYVEPRFLHASHRGKALSSSAFLDASGEIWNNATSTARNADEVLKELNAHGVTIVRIRKGIDGRWTVQPDALNRRITGLTPMELTGPVRGDDKVKTKYSPSGTMTRGTLNNCAHGVTPWNTYMMAEENWAGYFHNNDAKPPREHARYGVSTANRGRYAWEKAEGGADEFIRFNATATGASATDDYRNEPNCFGWMVEVDPFDPNYVPKKRTALGRFAHEGVVFAPAQEGKPVVCYSGDDATNEYIYKFVSRKNFYAATAKTDNLLDEGTLYVAKFNDDGTGEWIPLIHGQNGLTADAEIPFVSQADVLLNTRLAADVVGATKMDRPEWGAVDPKTFDVYFTLTNNTGRSEANEHAPNPRGPNQHGHIIRWTEAGGDPAATTFQWEIFVLAGDDGDSGVSKNRGYDLKGDPLDASNIFSAPDGLWFDPAGRLWIQTDIGEGSQNSGIHKVFGNNQMLCADPVTGEIRRFLTGPLGQEITGVVTTPDMRTMFINVQHPGATTTPAQWAAGITRGSWPDHDPLNLPPRSATVVIWKEDGGVIGS